MLANSTKYYFVRVLLDISNTEAIVNIVFGLQPMGLGITYASGKFNEKQQWLNMWRGLRGHLGTWAGTGMLKLLALWVSEDCCNKVPQALNMTELCCLSSAGWEARHPGLNRTMFSLKSAGQTFLASSWLLEACGDITPMCLCLVPSPSWVCICKWPFSYKDFSYMRWEAIHTQVLSITSSWWSTSVRTLFPHSFWGFRFYVSGSRGRRTQFNP